jgi:hypothetical protein
MRVAMAMVVVVMKVMRPAVVVLLDNNGRWAGDIDRSGRYNRSRRHSNCCRGPDRRVLHRRNHVRVYSLLSQCDNVARLQRSGNAIGAHMVNDELRGDAGASHLDYIIGSHGAYRRLHVHGRHLLSDLRSIARFNVVKRIADERSTKRTGARANQRPGAGIADGVADDRPYAGAA